MKTSKRNQKEKICWKSYWEEFVQYSAINGFGFMLMSRSTLERMFWVVCFILAAIFTVRGIEIEIEAFQDGSLKTEVSIKELRPFVLTNVTLCFPVDISKLNYKMLSEFGFDDRTIKTVPQIVQNIINKSQPFKSLKRNLQAIGSLLCKQMNVTVVSHLQIDSVHYSNAFEDICSPDHVVWLGPDPDFYEDLLCLDLTPEGKHEIAFHSIYDTVQIFWKTNPWYNPQSDQNVGARRPKISLNGGPVITQNSDNSFRFPAAKSSIVTVELNMILNKVGKCSSNELFTEHCILNCTAGLLQAKLNCVPYSFASFIAITHSRPVCSGKPVNFTSTSALAGCSAQCFERCNSEQFVFVVDSDSELENKGKIQEIAKIQLHVDQFNYQSVKESYSYELRALIANIAGKLTVCQFIASMISSVLPIECKCLRINFSFKALWVDPI